MGTTGDAVPRPWLAVVCISAILFSFVTTFLMPMGLLPDIAADLNRTEAQTGLLVTAYAWAVAILTLPLTVVLARFDRRTVLMGVLAGFVVSHGLAALAESFPQLFVARTLTAVAHAVFWGVSTPVAVRLAPESLRARALAITATGSAMAVVAGVPLGTFLGHMLGWRAAFLAVGAVGLVFMVLLAVSLPRLPATNLHPLRNLGGLLRNRVLNQVYVVMFLGTLAHATAFTYFTPFMRTEGGFDQRGIVILLLLFGTAGIGGSFLASRFTDRRMVLVTTVILCLFTLNFALGSVLASASVATAVMFCLVWGLCGSASALLFQSVLFKNAPVAPDVAMSMYGVCFNLAIGGGAALGAQVFERAGVAHVTTAGAILGALALGVWLLLFARSAWSGPKKDLAGKT